MEYIYAEVAYIKIINYALSEGEFFSRCRCEGSK